MTMEAVLFCDGCLHLASHQEGDELNQSKGFDTYDHYLNFCFPAQTLFQREDDEGGIDNSDGTLDSMATVWRAVERSTPNTRRRSPISEIEPLANEWS
eukprot:g73217.t1